MSLYDADDINKVMKICHVIRLCPVILMISLFNMIKVAVDFLLDAHVGHLKLTNAMFVLFSFC